MDYSKLPKSALAQLSEKDVKTIKENPGATMEQLAELGLTKKAEKLLLGLESNIKTVDPAKAKIMPKVTSTMPKVINGGSSNKNAMLGIDAVKYRNNKTGVTVTMDRKKAQNLVKQKPNKGSIIN